MWPGLKSRAAFPGRVKAEGPLCGDDHSACAPARSPFCTAIIVLNAEITLGRGLQRWQDRVLDHMCAHTGYRQSAVPWAYKA